MKRSILVVALALVGCGAHEYTTVSVEALCPLPTFDRLIVHVDSQGKMSSDIPIPGSSLPVPFSLQFNAGDTGSVNVTISAMAGTALAATGIGMGTIGGSIDVKLSPTGGCSSDMGLPDLAMADLTLDMPDQSTQDSSIADLTATSDLAMPDARAPVDAALADLQAFDLAAHVDAALPPAMRINFSASRLFGTTGDLIYRGLVVADFTGDARPDVISVGSDYVSKGIIRLYPNTGGGNLGAGVPIGPAGTTGGTSIAGVDLNGDNKLDLLITDPAVTGVRVLLGHGDGTFAFGATIATPAVPLHVAVADLDGDGKPDMIVTCNPGNSSSVFAVFLGLGAGNFGPPTSYTGPDPRVGLSFIADVSGDGKLDFVGLTSNNQAAPSITVFLGDGHGVFMKLGTTPAGGDSDYAGGAAAADLNGDGKLDIVVSANDGINVLLGTGGGAFAAYTQYKSINSQLANTTIDIRDWTGDGKLDVATCGDSDFPGVTVFAGRGDGSFAPGVSHGNDNGNAFAPGDIDGDGHLDTVMVSRSAPMLTVQFGTGTGFLEPSRPQPNLVMQDPSAADFNGDGKLDLIGMAGDKVNFMIADGLGGFTTSAITTAKPYDRVAIADFDGDGRPDFAAIGAEYGTNAVALFFNQGGVMFNGPTSYPLNNVGQIAAGDVDGDGRADLVATDNTNLYVFINQGAGVLKGPLAYPLPLNAYVDHLNLIDVSGDARPDVLIGTLNGPSGTAVVMLNHGDGTFAAPVSYTVNALDVWAADLNGDGKKDLIVSTGSPNGICILLGTGGGSFGPATAYPVLSTPGHVQAFDVDGDGKLDVLAASTQGFIVFRGNGDGTLGAPSEFGCSSDRSTLALGDWNSDGKKDIAVGALGTSLVLNLSN